MNLEDRYLYLCQTPSDIYEHLPTFTQAVHDLKATKVIELGVRYGVSTIAWLYALRNRGHLWAVDVSFPVVEPDMGVDLLNPQGELGMLDHWTFVLGWDTSEHVLNALPDQVDIVFIDTNHVYEETLVELELYYPRVRKGGRIYLHDTAIETTGNAVTPQPLYPVKTAVQEFCQHHGLIWQNNEACNGLGVIYCT